MRRGKCAQTLPIDDRLIQSLASCDARVDPIDGSAIVNVFDVALGPSRVAIKSNSQRQVNVL